MKKEEKYTLNKAGWQPGRRTDEQRRSKRKGRGAGGTNDN